jgi:signal transduction histidine kinase
MTLELAEVVAVWPLGASLAAAVALGGLREGRRRTALNEALHELRRPLQVLALAVPGRGRVEPSAIQGSVQMATTALDQLQREINGEALAPVCEAVRVRPLVKSAVGRWKGRAALAGGSLSLRWQAGEAAIAGDRGQIAAALDNLVVNAIEHGGPAVVVEAWTDSGKLRLAVVDCGRGARPQCRRESPAELLARISGRRLRGHGLRVVRRIAAAHGGDFRLRARGQGTEAVLELPLTAVAGDGA